MITSSVSRLGGGLFTSVRRLGQSLQLATPSMAVHVLSTVDRCVSADIGCWAPLDVRTHAAFGPWGFRYSPGIRADLHALDIDVVHVQHLWMYPSVATLGWHGRTGRPYIVSPRGMIDEWAMNRARLKKWLAWRAFEREHLKQASCIHALGESEIEGVRRAGIRTPICVIPNGIDVPPESSGNDGSPAPGGPKQLLFLGRLHPKKGLKELLAAWQQWRLAESKSAGEWQLVLAGWGEKEHVALFKRYANELRIQESVKFVGPAYGKEKLDFFRTASAFVLPSLSEGLPMAVLEAWACKLPVLITPQCNLAVGTRAGAAIPIESSVESIKNGLSILAGLSASDRRAIGNRGYHLVLNDFSWPRVATQMKEVYEWVIGGGQAPASVIVN